MAWSYTKPTGNTGWSDGNTRIVWDNTWTVTELTPTVAGYIRLQVSASTSFFTVSPWQYECYSEDTIKYGNSTVTIQATTRVSGSYGYTKTVQVPSSWAGKTISLNICWSSVSVKFGASPNAPSTVSAPDGKFGSTIPVTINPQVSNVTHTVSVTCAGVTETLLTNSASTSVNWTPQVSVYAPLITSAFSTTATISCSTTYNNSGTLVALGTSSKTITVSFEAGTLNPVVSSGWATHSYYNTGTAAENINAYVQGYSKALITFDSAKISCQYGATISGYSITYSGTTVTASPYLTGIIPDTSASILCTVTDSRGQTSSTTLQIAVNAYSSPAVSGVNIFRCDSSGVKNDDETYISVTATALISSINNLNSYTLTVYAKNPSGTYASQGTLTSGTTSVFQNFSPDLTWDIKIVVSDALSNSTYVEQRLPTRAWAMRFRASGNGVAFGKSPEHDSSLEVPNGWTLRVGEKQINTDMLGAFELGSVATSSHAIGEYFFWTNQFVRSTAAISIGDNIAGSVVASNITEALSPSTITFTITLTTGDWANNTQNVADQRFVASGYVYFVDPESSSRRGYVDNEVYAADNVTSDGYLTFYCSTTPSSALSVKVVRMVSVA